LNEEQPRQFQCQPQKTFLTQCLHALKVVRTAPDATAVDMATLFAAFDTRLAGYGLFVLSKRKKRSNSAVEGGRSAGVCGKIRGFEHP
jgi:hypothetical protein